MLTNNPIILKELLQAARQKNTFLARAALPAAATLLVGWQILEQFRWYGGQDWRTIARISRNAFNVVSWMQLIVFSLLAFFYCAAVMRREWTNKTMEVLCASPLSRRRILYGKFFAALSKLAMAALALLPVMGLWLYMGRLPREIVLGSYAVIAGSVVFFGAVALLQAAAFRPGRTYWMGYVGIILPYVFLIGILVCTYPERYEVIVYGLIPFAALEEILEGGRISGLSTGWFSLISFGLQAGMGMIALAAAPWLFGRALAAHTGGARKRGPTPTFHKRFREFFPRLRPPFEDAESRAQSRLISKAVCAIANRRPWAFWPLTFLLPVAMAFNELFFIDYSVGYYRARRGWPIDAGIIATGCLAMLAIFLERHRGGGACERCAKASGDPSRRSGLLSALFAAYKALGGALATALATYLVLAHGSQIFVHGSDAVFYLSASWMGPLIFVSPAVGVLAVRIPRWLKRHWEQCLPWVFWIALALTAVIYTKGGVFWAAGLDAFGYGCFFGTLAIVCALTVTLASLLWGLGSKSEPSGEAVNTTTKQLLFRVFKRFKFSVLGLVILCFLALYFPWGLTSSYVYYPSWDFLIVAIPVSLLGPFAAFLLGRKAGAVWNYLRRRDDPFTWQELGSATVFVRWAVWGLYALMFFFALLIGRDLDFLNDDDFLWSLLMLGLAMVGLVSLLFGAMVFAREKSHHRSAALLLTGVSPGRFFAAKIRALYLRLWPSLITVAGVFVIFCLTEGISRDLFDSYNNEERCFVLIMLQCLIFGPGLCMIIGMVFGLAARSVARAVGGLIGAGVWGFILFWILMLSARLLWRWGPEEETLYYFFAAFALPMAALLAFSRRWKPARLGLLLALNLWAVFVGLITVVVNWDLDLDEETVATIVGCILTWLSCLGWLWMGLRFFDAGLAGRPVSLRKERWPA